MSWKDNLRPASFRGVPFFVDLSNFNTGRKVALHEFPDRDDAFPEDLGQVPRTFKVDGHILGDDYFSIKKRLIEACEKEGPGDLIHPYYGTILVQCGPLSIDEDTGSGAIASISMQFYKAGDNKFPNNEQDKLAILEDRSGAAIDAAKGEFDDKFSIDGLPGFAVDTSRAQVAEAAEKFNKATEGLVTISEQVTRLAYNNRNLVAEVDDLLQSPGELSQRLLDSFQLLQDSIPGAADKRAAIAVISTFGSAAVPILGQTPTRQKQRDNENLFITFIQQVAIAKDAEYAGEVDFDSAEDATAARDEISDRIEEQVQSTENDDIFQTFGALNAILVKTVPDADNDLPNIATTTTKKATNSLVVIYDLFENIESEEDLIRRNKIKNPAYIEAEKTLEVVDVRR